MTSRPALGIIGGGKMAEAIMGGALDRGVLEPSAVLVAEPSAERRSVFEDFGTAVTPDAADCVGAGQIMLAVKPQVFPAIAEAIGPLERSTVVVSIMAGTGSAAIRRALGEAARVVRVMPNTPCRVGAGMTAIALGAGAGSGDEVLARRLFEAVGAVAEVTEDQMHVVTATSGSGPAYVMLLAEAMQQAAEQMGLPHGLARTLAEQTVHGAGVLLKESGRHASDLRQAVTSPGGTTAAALEWMFERELPEIVVEAMMAARDRGMELDDPPGRGDG